MATTISGSNSIVHLATHRDFTKLRPAAYSREVTVKLKRDARHATDGEVSARPVAFYMSLAGTTDIRPADFVLEALLHREVEVVGIEWMMAHDRLAPSDVIDAVATLRTTHRGRLPRRVRIALRQAQLRCAVVGPTSIGTDAPAHHASLAKAS